MGRSSSFPMLGILGSVLLAGSGCLMAIGNPGPVDYQAYAADSLTQYLKQNVCGQITGNLGSLGQSYCKLLVDTGKPHIQTLVSQTTQQRNFFLFSIYQTTLALPDPLPTYEFQTLGVMKRFYTYQASQISPLPGQEL